MNECPTLALFKTERMINPRVSVNCLNRKGDQIIQPDYSIRDFNENIQSNIQNYHVQDAKWWRKQSKVVFNSKKYCGKRYLSFGLQ